jgi:hypothetical protein
MLDAVNSNSDELAKLSQDKNKIEPSVHIERKLEGEYIESSENQTNIAIEKVVSSIEDKVAADAEKEEQKELSPAMDYNSLSMKEVVQEIKNLLKNEKIQTIKSNVESLRKSFDNKFSALIAQKKADFLADGGESIDFHYSDPLKIEFNEIIKDYRSKKDRYYSDLELQLKENLEKRVTIIDKLKELIEKADAKTMHKEFKELQDIWKNIGPVPRTKYNNTWRNYHHHVERFYDLLHMNNDLRELDFKHNLEKKIKIVEEAFQLSLLEDVSNSFKRLQELHKAWKEDVGPVSREFREEIWQKFSEATKIIHDKRDKYFNQQRSNYQDNIHKKLDIIKSLENFDFSQNKTHLDWQKSIKEFELKREVFFTIGKVPRNKSQKIWDQLKDVTRKFNHAKNLFYKDLNSIQHKNLEKKQALLELAKSLKDSDDFKNATGQMKKIQADWKVIGHVPRKYSDKIWKEFKEACNHYFDRIHQIQDNGTSEQIEAFETKKEFLSQIIGVIGNSEITLEEVKAYIKTWKNIGKVPRKDKQIEIDFNDTIEKLFGQLNIRGEELKMLKYKMQIDLMVSSNNTRKIESEIIFLRKRIDEITKGIQQLETNINFIANASEDNPLVQNVRESISEQMNNLKVWKIKLTYVRSVN